MSQSIAWLIHGVDPLEPKREELRKILLHVVTPLKFSFFELQLLCTAFDISFDGHENAPKRVSGEAYIFHPFRATLRMIFRQIRLELKDIKAIIEEMLHDCFEDAEIGGRSPLLVRSQVLASLGMQITYDVHCVTKHEGIGETSEEYCTRLSKCESWRPLWVKFEDREDNIRTLGSMPKKKQQAKIQETELWFPVFAKRMGFLIQREINRNKLSEKWLKLPKILLRSLGRSIAIQKNCYKLH